MLIKELVISFHKCTPICMPYFLFLYYQEDVKKEELFYLLDGTLNDEIAKIEVKNKEENTCIQKGCNHIKKVEDFCSHECAMEFCKFEFDSWVKNRLVLSNPSEE